MIPPGTTAFSSASCFFCASLLRSDSRKCDLIVCARLIWMHGTAARIGYRVDGAQSVSGTHFTAISDAFKYAASPLSYGTGTLGNLPSARHSLVESLHWRSTWRILDRLKSIDAMSLSNYISAVQFPVCPPQPWSALQTQATHPPTLDGNDFCLRCIRIQTVKHGQSVSAVSIGI
jgi:hypothetical protein